MTTQANNEAREAVKAFITEAYKSTGDYSLLQMTYAWDLAASYNIDSAEVQREVEQDLAGTVWMTV